MLHGLADTGSYAMREVCHLQAARTQHSLQARAHRVIFSILHRGLGMALALLLQAKLRARESGFLHPKSMQIATKSRAARVSCTRVAADPYTRRRTWASISSHGC